MSELPPNSSDELSTLFTRFLDQQLDEEGRIRLEELLKHDAAARDHCARLLLFDSNLKAAIEPRELEWLETRRVVFGKKDGRPSMRIQRSQEFRVGGSSLTERGKKKRYRLAAAAGLAALVIGTAIVVMRSGDEIIKPSLRNSDFEVTDLSLSTTGNTYSLIDWQDYFFTLDADLCEVARVTDGRIYAHSGRNVARLKTGGHLTQRLRDKHGAQVTAKPGARYVLSGWVYTDGQPPHVLRAALRVVASGWPAMVQYEAAHSELKIEPQSGWQPFHIELNLGDDLQSPPSDVVISERPLLELEGRELTLSIDCRGNAESLLYIDSLSLEASKEAPAP